MTRTETAELLDLCFDTVTMETAVARCLELCRAPRASHMVITANASHLCMMRRDPELALACRAAHLSVADGMSVVWALRASGQQIPERVAGWTTWRVFWRQPGNTGCASISSEPGARWLRRWWSGAGRGTPASQSLASAMDTSTRSIT